MSPPPVLIAGAGIAGLTLALCLARRGIPCRILERRDVMSEAGAGIQLGPNAMRVLDRLGLSAALEMTAGSPQSIIVADGATGRRLAEFPLGRFLELRHDAPYKVQHRADLQAALVSAVLSTDRIDLSLGFQVASIGPDTGRPGITATAADGETADGQLLVGADGIWSVVRGHVAPGYELSYSGKMAARTVIPIELAASAFRTPSTGVWLGRDAHVVHYPIRAHREIAVVVIVDEATPRDGWGLEIEPAAVLGRLGGFASPLLRFLEQGRDWRAWSLFDPAPLATWSRGRVCLLGDAAHPILPFLAQGGAMAIEDAQTLAELLSRMGTTDPAPAFSAFQAARRPRVIRTQDASRQNGRVFHMTGLMRLARNLALKGLPGSVLMSRYDWLYGWRNDPT